MKKLITSFFCVMVATYVFGQDTSGSGKQTIDPTKPTNLYTQVNTSFEYQNWPDRNLIGIRANVQYAFNKDNLALVEIPFLYNDAANAVGLGDIRIRYFTAVKRNITPKFIAIAPFADITLPTGSFEDGVGTSSWSLAGGVVVGFIINKRLSIFPGISYIHVTRPATDLLQEEAKLSSNGIGLQFNASVVFTKKIFLFVNPTPSFMNIAGDWKALWSGEIVPSMIIKPNKFKVNLYWGPNFTNDIHILKAGCTFFL